MMVLQLWQVKVSCPGDGSSRDACIATLQTGQGFGGVVGAIMRAI
jgi:hypothetical protein